MLLHRTGEKKHTRIHTEMSQTNASPISHWIFKVFVGIKNTTVAQTKMKTLSSVSWLTREKTHQSQWLPACQAADQLSIMLMNSTPPPLCSPCTGGVITHKSSPSYAVHTHALTHTHTGRCGTHHNLQRRLTISCFITRHLLVPEHSYLF